MPSLLRKILGKKPKVDSLPDQDDNREQATQGSSAELVSTVRLQVHVLTMVQCLYE